MKEFREIKSRENSLIKLTSVLQSSSKERSEKGRFVLEGLRICMDAFENGIRFDKLIISETAKMKYAQEIEKFSELAEECFILPNSLFKKISDTKTPQGIIVIAKTNPVPPKIDPKGRYLGLENIQDPSNLGAAARTCEALGVSGIILSKDSCDPYSPKSLRASMGTLLRLPVIILENFADELIKSGLTVYSCVVDKNAKPINSVKFNDGCVLLIGNEANGLTENTIKKSHERITIPMKGKAESLNAAVAASIAAWEMMK
ncbi:MAG: TrmH family RNA methyltransferase [Acutalibacteraceae bacterium]